MRSTIFRQYDSRWGSLGYPTKDSNFADNGCGCCACTHLVIEKDKYKDYTPKNLRTYMVDQGFAIRGQGTLWDGMTKTLEHYGFKVVKPNIYADMDEAWKELNKGNRAGVLLFSAGERGGVRWTSGGHYVAFLDYKVQNGEHKFYTKDSGARKNDGWHSYEKHMKGLLPQMWIIELPKEEPKKEPEKDTTTKYRTLGSMNFRDKAGTGKDSKVIATIPKDTVVSVKSVDKNGWGKLTYKSKTGYVRIKSTLKTYCKKVTAYKTLEPMNFRTKASTAKSSKVLCVIPQNKTIYVESVSDGWGKLRYQGKTGYVCIKGDKTYCKKV